MAQYFEIHPSDPQPRLVRRTVDILAAGGVIVYPTDTAYALGCRPGDTEAITRIRRIRGLDDKHHFTLVCRDLSELATYAHVDNQAYRLIKAHTPGPWTFILRATREVPRRLQHPRRRTIGLRVPNHPVAGAILEALGGPLVSTTLILPGELEPMADAPEIRDRLETLVDLVVDGGPGSGEVTTVVSLIDEGGPQVLRTGAGNPAQLGLSVD
ncbi:MAG: threonylcarbamoyl-AMP synthase [Gammaproteobacteria bacterium]|nr:threonylcarbamoyl-AMP synthase [Gammaproteobacteria bacterium]